MAATGHDKLFDLVESGSREALVECLEEEDTNFDLKKRLKYGKNPLELASTLGRTDIAAVLVEKGADVNWTSKSGYGALHAAAGWGHVSCLKVLVSGGVDHRQQTKYGETARDVALRYQHEECVQYLNCVEARLQLSQSVKEARDTLADGEKISGKWNKDDKSKVTQLCNEKVNWLDSNPEAPLDGIVDQTEDFSTRFQPYLAKLMPPEQ